MYAIGHGGGHRQVLLHQQDAEAGALQLKFYCYLGLRDEQPGGPEEQAEQAQFDGSKGYKAALLSTLKRTRELLAEGAL